MPRVIVLLTAVMIMFATASTAADDGKMKIKTIKPFTYVCMPFVGPYSFHSKVIREFAKHFFSQGLRPSDPLIAVYYNSPANTPKYKLVWEVGFPVLGPVKVKEPLKKKTWPFRLVAMAEHIGPYNTIGRTIGRLFAFVKTKGYRQVGPLVHIYADPDPRKVLPRKRRTIILMPVRKLVK